ncbi:MAG: U32 family peptidase [Prevotellaceae bacterium]|jgi:putative protease|nr:U32 family peptidase [Prevotellaceae bacterium]
MKNSIELLSPAKNLECGLAAVNHGADAVYIGAAGFGARAAAGNSIADIEKLTRYAHQFRARVYITLNTILTDSQLDDAEKLAWQLYEAGVDALIVQDMGLLMRPLPPIPLHASTQTDNRTKEKVQFLQQSGFSRVVLARELSLLQIADIKQNTDIELEVFVHGALCVSYSGQCYISQAACGRSANRGECAQFCRLPYDLTDKNGQILVKNRHLLSLKDLNLSDSVDELLAAGVHSLKIEGRLKDADYVKNITAFYRKKLDAVFEKSPHFGAASSGTTRFFFEPNPEKTFHRSATDFFLHQRKPDISQPETPKAMGEYIGKIKKIASNFLEIDTQKTLANGDGLCFINQNSELQGFRVNKTANGKVFPLQMPDIATNTEVFRNQDINFEKQLKGNTATRKIAVEITLTEAAQGIDIQMTDTDKVQTLMHFSAEKQPAINADKAEQNIVQQFSKLGDTILEAKEIRVEWASPLFFPNSLLGDWRKQLVENHLLNRQKAYLRELPREKAVAIFPEKTLRYTGNVANAAAQQFYLQRGVESIEPAFELQSQTDVPLMFCKHCIKFAMGYCPTKQGYSTPLAEPLSLQHGSHKFELKFNCQRCEMHVVGSLNS